MLDIAVKAGLPLVWVQSPDPINVAEIIRYVTGKTPAPFSVTQFVGKKEGAKLVEDGLYFKIVDGEKTYTAIEAALYKTAHAANATIIFVSETEPGGLFFPAGLLMPPKSMVLKLLQDGLDSEKTAKALAPSLGGLTLKEIDDVLRLTMAANGGDLKAEGILQTRRSLFRPTQGLVQVDPHSSIYFPTWPLEHWAAREKPFFLGEEDYRLVPRGLLFTGPPGTGKTEGAKFISRAWGVPLYRLDVATTKGKYVGTSEANLAKALATLDTEAPCIVLFDEIEKLFAGDDGSGVTQSMLSQLLWWMQERKARVLTVMTCNHMEKLPPELYREGRVDETLVFEGLKDRPQIKKFMEAVAAGYKVTLPDGWADAMLSQAAKAQQFPLPAPQAWVTSLVVKAIKAAKTSGKKAA